MAIFFYINMYTVSNLNFINRIISKGMSLMVDVDNVPAIRLYTSMGFEEIEGQDCVYATWQVEK